MTTIAYFNVGELTRNYYEKHPLSIPADCFYFEQSPDCLPPEEWSKIKNAEGISVFVSSTDVGEKTLSRLPRLKLIALRSSGYNNIDLDYCRKHGIEVVNVPGYGDSTVAEYTFGLLIALTRKICVSFDAMKSGKVDMDDYLGFDLQGRTIGIIGTGAIGRYAIQIARGFAMNILAYDPFPNEEYAAKSGFHYVDLDTLFSQSDILSLHCPLTKDNYHLLDADAFKKTKKGVVIINTARGELIDTEALYYALKDGIVGGAGLDVLEYETAVIHDDLYLAKAKGQTADCLLRSLINHRLLQLENVIITPHVAFNSIDAVHRILSTTNANIVSFLNGTTVNSVLNKPTP